MGTHAFEAGVKFELERKFYTLTKKVGSMWEAEESRSRRTEAFEASSLRKLLTRGDLTFLAEPPRPNARLEPVYVDPTDKRFESANVRLAYIKAIEGLPGTRRMIVSVIEETWDKLRAPKKDRAPSIAAVLRWRASYQAANGAIHALFDETAKRGNRTSKYDGDVSDFIDRAIAKKYMSRNRGTIQDVVDEAAAQIGRANRLRAVSDRLAIPTYKCVRRLIEEISPFDRHTARYGRESAVKKFRGVAGHIIADAPLQRAEIDHTVVDLTVVDENTGLPLGRPYITACLDSFSRCVLGIYISFEPPSYLTVSRCLKHALLPKDGLREKYPKIENDWVSYGTMTELVVDNGPDFHSDALRNACRSLGIEITYSPRAKPWFKGRIERFFGTLNRGVSHKAPGTNFASILERGDYNAAANAVVSYRAFEEAVNLWICDYYHAKPHRALNTSPSEMWLSNISDEEIELPDDASLLDAILGASETSRLTHKGIQYEGLFYNSPDLVELRNKHAEKLDVDIRVDRGDLGSIVVLTPDKSDYFKVPALDAEYAVGLTLWQHKVIKRFAREQLKKFNNSGWREAKLKLAELIDEQFHRQKVRTRQRMARFKGDAKLKGEAASRSSPTTTSPHPTGESSEPPRTAELGASVPTSSNQDFGADSRSGPETMTPDCAEVEAGQPARRKVFQARVRERINSNSVEKSTSGDVREQKV